MIVIELLRDSDPVYCQAVNHGRGDWPKLKNARKHNKGGKECEGCRVRSACNKSSPSKGKRTRP